MALNSLQFQGKRKEKFIILERIHARDLALLSQQEMWTRKGPAFYLHTLQGHGEDGRASQFAQSIGATPFETP